MQQDTGILVEPLAKAAIAAGADGLNDRSS